MLAPDGRFPDLPIDETVLGPKAQAARTPVALKGAPEMEPPVLAHFHTAPAPAMTWWDGPTAFEGFSGGWFRSSELTLYYVEGPQNGPPLLLFPGQTEPWHSYAPVLAELCRHFHVYVMELRGHGYSERSAQGKYRVIDYARDAAEFAEHVIGRPTIVSGHSLGAMMVMALWDLYPQWVIGASIEDAPFFIMKSGRYENSFLERQVFGPRRTPARAYHEGRASLVSATLHMANTLMPLPPKEALPGVEQRQYFVDYVMGTTPLKMVLSAMTPKDAQHFQAAWDKYVASGEPRRRKDYLPFPLMEPMKEAWLKTDWRTSCSQLTGEWIAGWDERRALSGMSVPTIFWAADKRLVPMHTDEEREEAERLVQTIERPVKCICAKGSGHYIHRDKPDLFAGELIAMFGQLEA